MVVIVALTTISLSESRAAVITNNLNNTLVFPGIRSLISDFLHSYTYAKTSFSNLLILLRIAMHNIHKTFPRYCIFILLLASAAPATAQRGDTTWYDAAWKTTEKGKASFFRTSSPAPEGQYLITDHYANGGVQMQGVSARRDSSYWNGRVNWYYPNGVLKQSAYYRDNKLSDSFYSYYLNGSPETVAFYKDGRYHGTARQYDSTGQITNEYLFSEGSLRRVQYYRDNKLRVSQSYLGKGNLDGETLEYSEEGALLSREMYRNGKRDGVTESFYPSGILKEKRNYEDGELNGSWQKFSESGQLTEQSEYRNGELQNRIESLDEHGTLVKSVNYHEGRQHGLAVSVTANGGQYKSFYRNDELDSTCGLYDKNGRTLMEASFRTGVLHGAFSLYLPGGFKTAAGFDNGSLVHWTTYYPDGKPYRVARMNADSLVEEWTTYDRNGNRIMETAYRFNNEYGSWKRYANNELVFRLENRRPILQDDLRYRRNRLTREKKEQENRHTDDEEADEDVTPEEIRNITGRFTDINELITSLPRRFFIAEDSVLDNPDPYNMPEDGFATWLFAKGDIQVSRDFDDYDSQLEANFKIPPADFNEVSRRIQLKEVLSADGLELIHRSETVKPRSKQLLVYIEHPSESVLKVLRFAMTARLKKELRNDPASVIAICQYLFAKYSPGYSLADITMAFCTKLYNE
ncbi:MAG TPA: hypothetical protein VF145_06295 [Chitinophagaceae bacterium]